MSNLFCHPHRRGLPFGLFLGGVLLLAVVLRLPTLFYRSLWTDELITIESMRLGWNALVQDRLAAGHSPLFFLLLKVWAGLFGEALFVLRGFSLIAHVLLLLAVALLFRRWLGERVCLCWAFLLAVHQQVVWAGTEMRPYGWMLLFLVVAGYGFLRLMDGQKPFVSSAVLYGASCLLTLWMHIAALPVLLATPLFLLLYHRKGGQVAGRARREAVVVGVWGAVVLSAWWLAAQMSGKHFRPLDSDWDLMYPATVFSKLLVGEYWYLGGTWLRTVGVLAGGGLFWRWIGLMRRSGGERRVLLFFAGWFWVVFVVLQALVFLNFRDKTLRYFLPAVPGLMVLVAWVATHVPEGGRWFRSRWVVLWGFLFVVMLALSLSYTRDPGDGVQLAMARLREEGRPGEKVFFCSGYHVDTILRYYGPVQPEVVKVLRGKRPPFQVRRELARALGPGEPFWLFLYKAKGSPLLDCARELRPDFQERLVALPRRLEVRLFYFSPPSSDEEASSL